MLVICDVNFVRGVGYFDSQIFQASGKCVYCEWSACQCDFDNCFTVHFSFTAFHMLHNSFYYIYIKHSSDINKIIEIHNVIFNMVTRVVQRLQALL